MMFEQSRPLASARIAQASRAMLTAAIALGLAFFSSAAALAQPSPQGTYQSNYQGDPPARAGRLSELNGQVWLLSADSNEWVSAVRNQPVTTGDRLATEAGARAEVQVGSSTVRLDGGSEIEVSRLDDDHLSLFLHSGSAAARLRDAQDAGEFDLSTDDGRFRALRAGRYRFDRKDNASHLTVYDGQAVYEGQNSALTVNPGQHAEFWIDQNNTAQYAMSGPYNDAFAAWVNERDRAPVYSGQATQYVSPEMTGAEDLDRYGSWEQTPEYGALWAPTAVAVDWAPYRAGHWAWVSPWGWTWVDDAPWGFAPFHYGRWVRYRDRWCWAPGQRVVRPVYAPALVAWMGGPNFSASIRIGGAPSVGWFPLAPREVYVPSYRASPRYVQNVNITHVTNVTVINNIYRNPQAPRDFANRRLPDALTVVPTSVMTARQPVAPAASKFRDAPGVREIANKPTPPIVVAPPVAAPVVAQQRPADRAAVKPPPGFPVQPGARLGEAARPPMGRGRGPTDNATPGAAPNAAVVQPGQRPGRPEVARPDSTPDRNAVAPAGGAPNAVQPPAGDRANRPERPNRPDVDRPDRLDERRQGIARPAAPAVIPSPAAPAQPQQPQQQQQQPAAARPAPPIPQATIPQGQIPNGAIPGQPQRGGNNNARDNVPPRPERPDRPDRAERQDRADRVERLEQQPRPQPHVAPQPAPQPVQRAPEPPRAVAPQPQPQPRPVEVQRPAPPAEVHRA
ncbi:MAG TPA: DUF6600 domain-containing protein, partial [Burkholderiaceae bacterium]|nr:DUF6600 domain-containing protein [Burkholderiaceae bacterium]